MLRLTCLSSAFGSAAVLLAALNGFLHMRASSCLLNYVHGSRDVFTAKTYHYLQLSWNKLYLEPPAEALLILAGVTREATGPSSRS